MLLNDKQIKDLGKHGHIRPFHETQVNSVNGNKVISYGVSSFGYDVVLSAEFIKIFPNTGIFDIRAPEANQPLKERITVSEYILNPGEMILGKTFEYIKMPRNCMALCICKSTYARQGLLVNCTPIEPQWEGHITLELSNVTNNPLKLYAFEGIAQLIFLSGETPDVGYADRGGKYQCQKDVTEARL